MEMHPVSETTAHHKMDALSFFIVIFYVIKTDSV